MIVVAISSAIDWSAFATICRVTGSDATVAWRSSVTIRLPLEHERRRSRGGAARSSRPGRRPSCRTRRRAAAPPRAPAPIEARDRTGTSSPSPPSHIRRVACRSRTSGSATSNEGDAEDGPSAASRTARSSTGEPGGRARRRAARARPRSALAAPRASCRSTGPAAARPRSPSSGRRSAGRRCAPTRARRGPANARRSTASISSRSDVDRLRVDRVDVEVTRADLVELGPREQQADGAEQPGHRRHERRS